jgi:hypothetical protein
METNKIENLNINDNTTEKDILVEKHLKYLVNLDQTKDLEAIGFFTNEHLKMAGKNIYKFLF